MSLEITILLSFLFTSIFGVIFHFAHQRFPKSLVVHIFCPVNESVWEHSKLTFSPMLIAGIFQAFAINDFYSNLFFSILISVVLGIVLMPLIYYPIRRLLKKEILWVSISIFYVVVISAYLLEYFMLKNQIALTNPNAEFLSLCLLFVIVLFYAVLTFLPPRLGIFKDTVKKKYGDFR
jgi:small-conductance mechanosensitive channel